MPAGWFYKCRLFTFTHQLTKKKEAKKKVVIVVAIYTKSSIHKSKGPARAETLLRNIKDDKTKSVEHSRDWSGYPFLLFLKQKR